jgi:hypothetical protein
MHSLFHGCKFICTYMYTRVRKHIHKHRVWMCPLSPDMCTVCPMTNTHTHAHTQASRPNTCIHTCPIQTSTSKHGCSNKYIHTHIPLHAHKATKTYLAGLPCAPVSHLRYFLPKHDYLRHYHTDCVASDRCFLHMYQAALRGALLPQTTHSCTRPLASKVALAGVRRGLDDACRAARGRAWTHHTYLDRERKAQGKNN